MRIVRDDWVADSSRYIVFDAVDHYSGSLDVRLRMFTPSQGSYSAAELREIAEFIDKQAQHPKG